MTPGGEIIPITEDDQGEGMMDVFEEMPENTFLEEQIKRQRRKAVKNISKI